MQSKTKLLSIFFIIILIFNILYIPASAASSWDSRQFGIITPVKQQDRGICWAYTICSVAETDVLAQGMEKNIDFSEAYLYTLHNSKLEEISETNDADSPAVITTLAQNYNILAYESDFPYYKDFTYSLSDLNKNNCPYTIESSGFVNKEDVKDWIKLHGSIICGLYMDEKDTHTYINHNNSYEENHAVTIIGWDDNISPNMFQDKPQTSGAWLCKNSWGTKYGDNGYFWLSYEDAGIGNYTGITVKKLKPSNRLSYCAADKDFNFYSLSVSGEGIADSFGIGDVFKLSAGDNIQDFDVILGYNNSVHNYNYSIYKLNSSSISALNITSDNLIASGSIPCKFTTYGFYSIPVNYTAQKDEYIFAFISNNRSEILEIGAEENSSGIFYSVQLYQNEVFSIKKESGGVLKLGLITAKPESQIIQSNSSTTVSNDAIAQTTLNPDTYSNTETYNSTTKTDNSYSETVSTEKSDNESRNSISLNKYFTTLILIIALFVCFIRSKKTSGNFQ